MPARFPVALVGVGKIARDQHIPAIAADPDFELVAAVSRNATIEGVPSFTDLDTFLADGPPAAVALCVPPEARTAMALKALAAGRDVLLEKPPAATLGEVDLMVAAARDSGRRALRHLALALRARRRRGEGLARRPRRPRAVSIVWKEDVRRWHPNQAWIWQPGGFGVFDPGINALSLLTEILPGPFVVDRARLVVPENCETPIAADFAMTAAQGFPVERRARLAPGRPADLGHHRGDRPGPARPLARRGGDGRRRRARSTRAPDREYPLIYRRFADLLARARERGGREPAPHHRRRLPGRRAARRRSRSSTDG